MIDPNEEFLTRLGEGFDSDTAGRIAFGAEKHLLHEREEDEDENEEGQES